jgi:acetyltransferase-like isoleucine patch superfamily enzyme
MMSDPAWDDIVGSWDYTTLPANVRFGQDCWFERRSSFARFKSTRQPGLVIGDRVQVYTWTTFNVEPEGLLEVGDDTVLVGPVFMCAEHIRLGRRVILSYNVTIADSDFHPLDAHERRQDAVANAPFGDRSTRPRIVSSPVSVGDDVWVGIGAIILKGVTIGRGARIGAGAVVSRDVPAGMHVEGNPARPGPALDA